MTSPFYNYFLPPPDPISSFNYGEFSNVVTKSLTPPLSDDSKAAVIWCKTLVIKSDNLNSWQNLNSELHSYKSWIIYWIQCPGLSVIDLSVTNISFKTLCLKNNMKNLRKLYLDFCTKIDSECFLANLASFSPHLEYLSVYSTLDSIEAVSLKNQVSIPSTFYEHLLRQ